MSQFRRVREADGSLFKYSDAKAAAADMRRDYMVRGMAIQSLYDKYAPQIATSYTLGGFQGQLSRYGITRKAVKRATPSERREARQEMRNEIRRGIVHKIDQKAISQRMAESIASLEKKGAERHFLKMEKIVDRAHEEIEIQHIAQPKGTIKIGPLLYDAKGVDDLSRKLFRMDDQKPVGSHEFNLTILTMLGHQAQSPRLPGQESMEAEVVKEDQTEAMLLERSS